VPLVCLATAHPAKFAAAVEAAAGVVPEAPEWFDRAPAGAERFTTLANDPRAFEDLLLATAAAVKDEV
jgi:threonine synthase